MAKIKPAPTGIKPDDNKQLSHAPINTRRKRNTPTRKQQVIIDTKRHHPDLNTREIAAVANTDHSHVSRTLAKYGFTTEIIDRFKSCRADIFAGIQEKLLSSITTEDVKKAPLGSRILAACQIYDKERLERNLSAANTDTVMHAVHELRSGRKELPTGNGQTNEEIPSTGK